jgi:hypothetical protein
MVVIDSAPTITPIKKVTRPPPRNVYWSVEGTKVVLEPTLVVEVVEADDASISAWTIPAGTAMTSIALAMETKFLVQILNEASIRSPTPSGLSMPGGGVHIPQSPLK